MSDAVRQHVFPIHGIRHKPDCDRHDDCECWRTMDDTGHITDGTPCWCAPEVHEVLGTDTLILVHRDNRC